VIVLIAAQAVILFAGMSAAWWFQRKWGNAGWVDVFWTFVTGGAGVFGALWPLSGTETYPPRQIVSALLIAFWAFRLGTHLRSRVLSRPEDARYAEFRRDWGASFQPRMFGLLVIQAIAALPLAVAVLIAARNPLPSLCLADIVGVAVYVVSVLGEAVSDRQLARFVHDPANHGRVCDAGLWAWSRHPNYFFEFFGWCAWPFIAFNPGWPLCWVTLLAPVLMYWLLVRISGIPPLERVMLASRGDAYRDYQQRTSAFFPLPPGREAKP
jgi:steroid 5-alpha reductase family enzyme